MTQLDTLIRRAWPIFREAIRAGRTLTYTELAGRLGRPLNRRHIHRQLLTPLSLRCRQAGLPDLAALVVRKDTGMPGGGWHALEGVSEHDDPDETWAEALARCLVHPWADALDERLLTAEFRGEALG